MRLWIVKSLVAAACAALAGELIAAPSRWISGDNTEPEKPAPMLLKEFKIDALPAQAVFSVAVAGWCENSVETYPA